MCKKKELYIFLKIKADIIEKGGDIYLKPSHSETVEMLHFKPVFNDAEYIKMQITELKKLDKFVDQTNIKIIKQPTQINKLQVNAAATKAPTNERIINVTAIQTMGTFDLFGGGSRVCKSRHRRRQ